MTGILKDEIDSIIVPSLGSEVERCLLIAVLPVKMCSSLCQE